jgi:hypothetical protein
VRTIYKYAMEITDEVEIEVPRGATLLKIDMQSPLVALQSWWIVDPDEVEVEHREFTISGTGHPLPAHATMTTHRETVVDQASGLVWHVFEVID